MFSLTMSDFGVGTEKDKPDWSELYSCELRAAVAHTPEDLAPGPRNGPDALRDWNSVPVLVEGKDGGFATSGEFLCHV
jgi:hypothetical protein